MMAICPISESVVVEGGTHGRSVPGRDGTTTLLWGDPEWRGPAFGFAPGPGMAHCFNQTTPSAP